MTQNEIGCPPPGKHAPRVLLSVLTIGLLASCASGRSPSGATDRPASAERPPPCEQPDRCSTRALADAAHVALGTAVSADHLDESAYRKTIVETYNSVTPENALKWDATEPERGTWTFKDADRIVAFAQAHHIAVKGHNLLWDQASIDSTPDWVLNIDDPTRLRAVIADHITTVMHRYHGKVDRWDVVNEPLETIGTALYDNHFRQVLGDGYIAEAFEIAHRANPTARLYLNEAAVEYQPKKAVALVALVRSLVDRGVPIDGVGLQAHLISGSIGPGVLRQIIHELEGTGVKVAITELDVPTTDAPDPLAAQASTYDRVLAECFAESCREVTTWGLTDRYTWLNDFLGAQRTPLPFDRNYHPKPALGAIRAQLIHLEQGT